jgi:hypothetical protein
MRRPFEMGPIMTALTKLERCFILVVRKGF